MRLLLGELEQKLMDIMWESNEPLKPADVSKKLKNKYAYTTVMTVLKKLYDKKLLKRELKGKVYFYSVQKQKETFAKNKLKNIYKILISSYGDLALTQFVDAIKTDKIDLENLEKFLKKAKNGK